MPYRKLIIFIVLALVAGVNRSAAQALPDTSLNKIVPDSLVERKEAELNERTRIVAPIAIPEAAPPEAAGPFQPKPKKSALYAAILPGSGQIYNRQYWKVPVVYGLAAVAGYFLIDNTKGYRRYRKAYVSRLTNPSYQDEFSSDPDQVNLLSNLQREQDYYKKNLDLTYLLTGVGYLLQVMDALAFAHLKNFDVSPNISMRMAPAVSPHGGLGLGVLLAWK